jgi:hypothetical protein
MTKYRKINGAVNWNKLENVSLYWMLIMLNKETAMRDRIVKKYLFLGLKEAINIRGRKIPLSKPKPPILINEGLMSGLAK